MKLVEQGSVDHEDKKTAKGIFNAENQRRNEEPSRGGAMIFNNRIE